MKGDLHLLTKTGRGDFHHPPAAAAVGVSGGEPSDRLPVSVAETLLSLRTLWA